MKYQSEIGKIYDTLFFCIEYFNEQAVKDTITNRFEDTSFMDKCYQEVNESVPSLPPILKPLFLYQNQTPTVMIAFFKNYIDYQNDTIHTFLQKITEHSDFIYSKTLSTLFPEVSDIVEETVTPLPAPESFIRTLNESNYSEDFKLQISLLFGNFNYALSLLTEQLVLIFQAVDRLHHKYVAMLDDAYKEIHSERNLKLYSKVLGTDISHQTDEYNCTIAFLNQYIALLIISEDFHGLLLGIHYEEDLSFRLNEKNIDVRQLLIAVGNDTRLTILQVLAEQHEMTASAIARIINTPLTTVLRHIEILYGSGAVFISKKSGLKIFYRLNDHLLKNAFKIMNNRIGELSNEQTANKVDKTIG